MRISDGAIREYMTTKNEIFKSIMGRDLSTSRNNQNYVRDKADAQASCAVNKGVKLKAKSKTAAAAAAIFVVIAAGGILSSNYFNRKPAMEKPITENFLDETPPYSRTVSDMSDAKGFMEFDSMEAASECIAEVKITAKDYAFIDAKGSLSRDESIDENTKGYTPCTVYSAKIIYSFKGLHKNGKEITFITNGGIINGTKYEGNAELNSQNDYLVFLKPQENTVKSLVNYILTDENTSVFRFSTSTGNYQPRVEDTFCYTVSKKALEWVFKSFENKPLSDFEAWCKKKEFTMVIKNVHNDEIVIGNIVEIKKDGNELNVYVSR